MHEEHLYVFEFILFCIFMNNYLVQIEISCYYKSSVGEGNHNDLKICNCLFCVRTEVMNWCQ